MERPQKQEFYPAFHATFGVELILFIILVFYEGSQREKAANKIVIDVARIRYLFIVLQKIIFEQEKLQFIGRKTQNQEQQNYGLIQKIMVQREQKSLKKKQDKKQNKRNDKGTSKLNMPSQQEVQALRNKMLQDFFTNQLQRTTKNIDISLVNQQIVDDIVKGQIKVSQRQKNLASLIRSKQQQALKKITPQQMQLYQKQAKRIQHLKLISNLNKQLTNKQPQESISYILTKDEHQRKVRQIIDEKQNRQKRLQEAKQLMKQRIERQQRQAQEKQQIEKNQQKQKKRIQIQQKITKQKQEHIHFLSSDIQHRKVFQQVMKKVPLHIKMKDTYKNDIQTPSLEQKKLQYKELREFKQKYSIDNIKQYEKQYIQKSKFIMQQSNIKKSASLSRISQITKKVPEKSQRLKAILAEEIQNFKSKLISKEAYIEQKLKREENYLQKLKQKPKPKIDKDKRQQIIRRLLKQKEHLSKVGLNINERKIGLQYLSNVKKQALKLKQKGDAMSLRSLTSRSQQKSDYSLPLLKRSYSQRSSLSTQTNLNFLARIRQIQMEKILSSDDSSSKKIQKLKIQAQKIQEAKQRKLGSLKHNFNESVSKQASSLALNSIKAKINLIDLMKNK